MPERTQSRPSPRKLDQACFGHPRIPSGTSASLGPAQDCVVDKIEQFRSELASPNTPPEEQIVALKLLLHFVGDLHQPQLGPDPKAIASDLIRHITLEQERQWA